MKIMMMALFIVATVATLLANVSSQRREEKNQTNQTEAGFYCRLDALTPAERERHLSLWKSLQAAKQAVRELDNGYAIGFPGDSKTLMAVAEFISRERRCCPFFTFEIEAAGEDKPLWLRLTGNKGVKEFIKTEIGIQ
ncbi:MAG: hypothetical protein AB1757_18525 [Acidobacteriota bacterium]